MTSKINKINVESQYTALCQALQGLSDADSIILGNKSYKKGEILSVFQGCLAAIAATQAAHTDWLKTASVEKATRTAARPLRAQVKSYLDARLGKDNPALTTFGFKPAKPRQVKVKTKAAAIDKSKATRTARHTLGSNQKKAVKGAPPPAPTPPAPSTTGTTPASPAGTVPSTATHAPSGANPGASS
jgi:hypothetical protein